MMSAYNKLAGTSSAVSPLLKSLVIGEWGFDGTLCTDAWGPQVLVNDQMAYTSLPAAMAAIIKGGTGLILQDQADARPAVMTAYSGGMITVADIDAASRANLRVRFRLGDFDPPARVPYKSISGTATPWNTAEYKTRALDVARKTVVLLKNTANTLPLAKTGYTAAAVVGPRADTVLRDWYGGLAPYKITGRQGIATKLGSGVTVVYAADNNGNAATSAAMTAATAGGPAIVFVGNHPTCGNAPPEPNPAPWATCPTGYEGREAVDRKMIGLDPGQLSLVQSVAAANPKTIVVLVSSFPQGVAALESDPNVKAIVHIANSGQELGTAIADVLFGDYNPGGRTVSTWYRTETEIPTTVLDYDIRKGTTYWYFAGTPLYPFGHGLSYTTFAYSNLTLSASTRQPGELRDHPGRHRRAQQRHAGRRRGRAALRRVSGVDHAAAAAQAAARLQAHHPGGGRHAARDLRPARQRADLLGRDQPALRRDGGDGDRAGRRLLDRRQGAHAPHRRAVAPDSLAPRSGERVRERGPR